MTTRIGGDFNSDAVEAFRAAYAQILNSPDDDTVANESGLLTDTVANTSPWHNHLPLWKYPSGKGPDEDLKRSFDPDEFISKQEEEEAEYDDSPMTDEEVETLIDELLNSTDEDETEEDG
jgi:hypothetical protein